MQNLEFKNVKITLCGFLKISDPPHDVFVTLLNLPLPLLHVIYGGSLKLSFTFQNTNFEFL